MYIVYPFIHLFVDIMYLMDEINVKENRKELRMYNLETPESWSIP